MCLVDANFCTCDCHHLVSVDPAESHFIPCCYACEACGEDRIMELRLHNCAKVSPFLSAIRFARGGNAPVKRVGYG